MKVYPSCRYHPEHGSRIVKNEAEDRALAGWFLSPAEFGVETCPGKAADPAIAAKRGSASVEETALEQAEEFIHQKLESVRKIVPRKAKA